ncbi:MULTISPECIES: CHAD domain-containing protein [unclassified Leifsonia]|uniref:CHAD domain-containing protein n=1 Tax=unclassified Leifsonia TaxID=2663824 RepID=UPI0003A00C78|nr:MULTISPECIES: CHAD domain-containing protein [unclassified Leifsonia]TDQ03488.1 CHAD domain-containing protein [Leifsonia sp. 115AMFTsu3.1]
MYALVGVSAELAEQLVAIETGGEDAVHQARTRVRRLRSILSVYRSAFDREQQRAMRARLKRLGERLGRVRDAEVRARDLDGLLGAESTPELVDAVEALAAEAGAEHDRALEGLLEHLHGRAHRTLLADLQAFAADPPLAKPGRKHPRRVVRKGLAKAARRVRKRSGQTLEQRHETRKAARRLRYAAEAVVDDLGREAVRIAAAAEAVQDALGDHRDLVLLARHLRDKADEQQLSASAVAGIALLAAECDVRAEELLAGLDDKLAAIEP